MFKPPKATLKHVKYHLHTFKNTYQQIIPYSSQAHKYILNIPQTCTESISGVLFLVNIFYEKQFD